MNLNFEKVKTLPEILIPGTIYWVDDWKTTVIAETFEKYKKYNGDEEAIKNAIETAIVDAKTYTDEREAEINKKWDIADEQVKEYVDEKIEVNANHIKDLEDEISELSLETNVTLVSEKIPVAGGPLSSILNEYDITEIEEGTDLQSLLLSLFCKEIYPDVSKSISGTINGQSGLNKSTISCTVNGVSKSTNSLVEPGTPLKFKVTQGNITGTYTTTSRKISGFTHGYSLENDNQIDSTDTSITRIWTVNGPSETSYELNASVNGTTQSKSSDSAQTIEFDEFPAKIGNNTCTSVSKGTWKYTGTIEGFPKYYIVSNLGKTNEKYYTDSVSEETKTVISGNSSGVTDSHTIIGVYPVYNNVSSGNLSSDTTTKMSLSTSKEYNVSNIPSEETSDYQFMFDFPTGYEISEVTSVADPTAYYVYSNISNGSLSENVEYNHGKWKSGTTLINNVPSEIASNRHFVFEYPASGILVDVKQKNPVSGDFDVVKYNSESITRNGDSYVKVSITGTLIGSTDYQITFNEPERKTEIERTDYEITESSKMVDGKIYKRFITKNKSGVLSRTITFNKSLNNV